MLRRSLIVVSAFTAVLVLAGGAAAALVHIRVEGKTLTIFGPTNPTEVASTPLQALQIAAQAGEFYAHVTASSFGNYVDQIGFYPASGDSGWVFKVNGVSPPVAADQLQLKDGDVVEWYYATFGPNGGPPTLTLKPTAKGCYFATGQDDSGASAVPAGLVYHVDGRTISAPAGRVCLTKTHGLVWATAPGAIRSNRLP
ncbi:MAG TPA: DUF4430 domain-containing protein [Gaiellaceae bacterium]|nr:DUF4430 domain-containing protein [Gaiellaceae bacterium]